LKVLFLKFYLRELLSQLDLKDMCLSYTIILLSLSSQVVWLAVNEEAVCTRVFPFFFVYLKFPDYSFVVT